MVWTYLIALIVGGVFTVPVFFGGLDLDTDSDFDFDADVDLDTDLGGDLDTDADLSVGDSDFAEFAAGILSFRSIVFFLFFFGLTGSALRFFGSGEPFVIVAAVILGLMAAMANSALLQWLRNGETSSQLTNEQLVGARAQIVIPPGAGGRGRVRAIVDGQPRMYSAQAYRTNSDQIYSVGDKVVVIEIDNGTALVAPLPANELGE